MNLAFDIETIPDIAALRLLHDLPAELLPEEVAAYAFQKRRAEKGDDFLPPHLHCPVVISLAFTQNDRFVVKSLAQPELSEVEMLRRFFAGIDKYTPQLISWNGKGFDMPVLHYRSLIHRVQAPRYWDLGDGDSPDSREFKWNNYISRYQQRHLDLMDLLALYQRQNFVGLDALARMMGLPGKQGLSGDQVWPYYLAGRYEELRHYCEGDAILTYLLFLHFQHMRGSINDARLENEKNKVRQTLAAANGEWQDFLEAWL